MMRLKKYYRGFLFSVFVALSGGIVLFWGAGISPFAALLKSGDYLLNLVTKRNSLGAYAPFDLIELSLLGAPGQHIRAVAMEPLKNLMTDAEGAGLALKILSSYRSYASQKSLFSFYKKRFKDAERFSAEAGNSEHQLGTTVDFGIGNPAVDLKTAFARTAEGQWLARNAWRYGFVMSYPEGKEAVTGYIYEPWHFRFAGLEAARMIQELNLTPQEYFLQQPQEFEK